jgi:hypothetical protein
MIVTITATITDIPTKPLSAGTDAIRAAADANEEMRTASITDEIKRRMPPVMA